MNLIAVDGPAGVGKSSVCRGVARRMGYGFLSSGLVYRALAWVLAEAGWDGETLPDLDRIRRVPLTAAPDGALLLEGKPIAGDLRSEAVSAMASRVSAHPEVRDIANGVLRDVVDRWLRSGDTGGVILEGRDIGTVVYPDAPHKIFLTASPEVRAERRWLELREQDPTLSLESVLTAVRERDHRDETRAVAPLKAAEDAIIVDTSDLDLEGVIEAVLQHLRA